jgi:rhodanese-related sulfurtransferase
MRRILIWVSNLFFFVLAACGQQYESYSELLKSLYKNSVPVINAAELHALQQSDTALIILDAREPNEFKVSHLLGAQHAGYDHFAMREWKSLPKDSKIVVYCSVGYRSERVGEKLKAAGFEQVYNLYGGIFQWKNEGYEVYHNEEKTERVHAYSPRWGKWLEKGERVYD